MSLIRSALWIALPVAAALAGCEYKDLDAADGGGSKDAALSAAVKDDSPVLALVNGEPVTRRLFDIYARQRAQRQPSEGTPEEQQDTLDELINTELVVQDALEQDLHMRPDVATQIQLQQRSILAGAAIREYVEAHPITDEEIEAAYQERTADFSGQEYKARHILVKSEEEAEAIIKQLDEGADFAELAKEKSTGPTGKKGGDLGWFSPNRMVPAFSEAAAGLEPGQYTQAPVQTQFGWHVVLLEDTREASPPPLAQLKPQLQAMLQNQRIQAYLKELQDAAQIEVKQVPEPPQSMSDADGGDGAGADAGEDEKADTAPAENAATDGE